MRFYLGDRTNEVQVLVRPCLTRCKDETFDSMIVTLPANDRAEPYAPRQNFIIDMETTPSQVLCFVVESDEVSLFSTSPLKYQHTLNLIEKKKYLQYHLVRNSSFTNEAGNYQKQINCAVASSILNGQQGVYDDELERYYDTYAPIGNSWTNQSKKTLVGSVKNATAFITYNANFFYFYGVTNQTATYSSINNDFTNLDQVNNFFNASGEVLRSSFLFDGTLLVKWTDANDVAQTRTITMNELGVPNVDYFGKKYRSEYITNLLNNGAKDVSIEFYNNNGAIYNDGLLWSATNEYKKPIAFNCMVQIDLEYEDNNKNCYEILELLLKRQRKDTALTISSNTDLFNLPDATHYPELKELLQNTIAPNFYFSQATMYECVAEIFRIFDATFTIDEDNYINIDYFNEKTRQVTIDNQIVGINQTLGADKFTNGIVTHYQDARTIDYFPGKNTYTKPRSQKLGVPDESDHCLLLPHDIHQLKKVVMLCYAVTIDTGSGAYAIGAKNYPCSLPLDITDWVVESSIWSSLSSSSTFEWNKKKQNNTINYDKGSNVIHLAHSYKTRYNITYYSIENLLTSAFKSQMGAPGATGNEFESAVAVDYWYSQGFRVEYYTSVEGRTKVESLQNKYNGEMLIDQNNGAIDLNKMGSNMLGIAMKSGEPNKTVTITLRNWSDRIEEGAYTSDGYVANIVKYTFLEEGKIQEQIQFVKNFNALSQRIKLMREKRLSNISGNLLAKSEDNLINYFYFSATNFDDYEYISGAAYISETLFATFIRDTFLSTKTYDISFATIENNESKNVESDYVNKAIYDKVYIPLVKYGAGNCVCFEMSFNHPINAGNYTVHNVTGWWELSSYFTGASFYTDKHGEFEQCTIQLWSQENSKKEFSEYFPHINTDNSNQIISIHNYRVYKQPNEIFGLNYEMCFLAKDIQNEFVGSEFINENAFIKSKIKRFYIYFSTETYDILDRKVASVNQQKAITSVISEMGTGGKFRIVFGFPSIQLENYKSWAIGDENGNIYFAFNEDLTGTFTNKSIYFYSRGNRRI